MLNVYSVNYIRIWTVTIFVNSPLYNHYIGFEKKYRFTYNSGGINKNVAVTI